MYIFRREYGGLGDRHQQNSVNYTLDLNAGLTQVLSAGTNTYLYGNGRISQHATQTEYFLGDALGSVRQLADSAGAVTLTQSYAPYGDIVSSVGTGSTDYAFTGEIRDANGLTYLRARYLNSSTGRFTQRDPSRLETNLYLYAGANPVMYTDPSGKYHRYVHYDLTLKLAKRVGKMSCVGETCPYVELLSQIIASGNQHMDDSLFLSAAPWPWAGGWASTMLHFADPMTVSRNVDAAIAHLDPFLFGATLHQLQDTYSHWREGYNTQSGHGAHSIIERTRSVSHFYEHNSITEIKTWLSQRYSLADINSVSENRLIDLYSQELGYDGLAYIQLVDMEDPKLVNLRANYGYEPDYYFGFTRRDVRMEEKTSRALGKFFRNFDLDECEMERFWLRYTYLTDQEIKDFLEGAH